MNIDRSVNLSKVKIFANGDLSIDQISLPVDEIVIAADGGARHCLKLGITPNVVIGDFDSLAAEELATLESAGTAFIRYPADKDETDLALALDHALALGASDVTLYGLFGGRWDMTFANLLLLASPRYAGIRFRAMDGSTAAYILRGGETLELSGQPGDTVSTIPLKGPVSGICYKGLQWPLENATLAFGSPRGMSNVMRGTTARISLREGVLLVFQLKVEETT